MYLMVCNRPDISYAVFVLSRFMSQPKMKHLRFVKQLLKYVKSTRDYSLVHPNCGSTVLTGYSDSDHAGDLGDRKSTTGYIFILSGIRINNIIYLIIYDNFKCLCDFYLCYFFLTLLVSFWDCSKLSYFKNPKNKKN